MQNTTSSHQLGLTLATNSKHEFSRIPNQSIENWTY